MSRIPQPDHVSAKPWRPEPSPADYRDDISEPNFAALQEISTREVAEDEFEIVDGPAW